MKVFIEFSVHASAIMEKEVPDGSSYHDIVNSVTRDDMIKAEVQIGWNEIKSGWRGDDSPHVYQADEDGIISWNEPIDEPGEK